MKLFTGPTTPFGRKAAIVAREHGIALDEEVCNPFESEELARINPLKLIPVLVLDDGAVLHDSHVICEYLDALGSGSSLYPEADKWTWKMRMILGHGLAEASVQLQLQKVLPESERSETMMERYHARIERAAAVLEDEADALAAGEFRIDKVTAACGLGHLELRHGDDWRRFCPRLAAWYAEIVTRPSVAETMPRA